MAEVRVDPETGDWRIVAPERAVRPVDRPGAPPPPCPFCPGNEAMTPPEVLRAPAGADAWQIRGVPNKFAFVAPADGDPPPAVGAAFPATGRNEVLVESRRHDWDLRLADPAEATAILFALRERCRALTAAGPAVVIAFRNYGRAAGSSLSHPHCQIVSLDHAPPGLERRWTRARDHHAGTGRCLHDDLAAAERCDGTRVVADSDGVLVYQPRAASVPHETVLMPSDESGDLAGAADHTVEAVARVLPSVLAGLCVVRDDPAYNLVIHSGPANVAEARRWFRWHIGLYPRVTTTAGLEIATGLAVNPTAPEVTAPILREAVGKR